MDLPITGIDGDHRLAAVLILGQHSELALALAGNRSVPGDLAGVRDWADGLSLRWLDTGSDSENQRHDEKGLAELLHKMKNHKKSSVACKPTELFQRI